MAIVEGAIDIQTEKRGDLSILHFKGKLDALSSPSAESKILDCINTGNKFLLFDFAGVDYLSSAGLRVLLSAAKKIKNHQGALVVTNVQECVMGVLKITGFDHLLDLADSQEAAEQKIFSLIKPA